MIEPEGITTIGNTVEFRLDADTQILHDLRVEWKISSGKIEKGQGTAVLVVRTRLEPLDVQVIVAEATISGLPKDCTSVYRGAATASPIFDPIILDEWGKLSANDQRGRLDNVLQELSQYPAQVLLIILDSEKGSSEKELLKRVKLIKNHVFGLRKSPPSRIIIASEAYQHENSIRIYRVPREAARSICGNCRVH